MKITAKAIANKIEYLSKVGPFKFEELPEQGRWVFEVDHLRIERGSKYIKYVVVKYKSEACENFVGSDAILIIQTVQKIRISRSESITKEFERYLEVTGETLQDARKEPEV